MGDCEGAKQNLLYYASRGCSADLEHALGLALIRHRQQVNTTTGQERRSGAAADVLRKQKQKSVFLDFHIFLTCRHKS